MQMKNDLTFLSATEVIFGAGAVKNVGAACKGLGLSRVLVVSDPFMVESGTVKVVTDVLDAEGIAYAVYSDFEPAPTVSQVKRAADYMKQEKFEGIIGFGGGSSMDTGKAIGVLYSNDCPVEDCFGINKVPKSICPTIMIPTTAGTGSEVSNACILRNDETGIKSGICSRYLMADVAIGDPELTVSCPKRLTASAGMDAYAHCIEGYVSNNANKLTRLFHAEAIKLISANLKKCVDDGSDLEARSNMLLGSLYAGWAMAVASLGACHAMAYAVEAKYHASHGDANASLLPSVMKFNAPGNAELYAEVAEYMGIDTAGMSVEEASSAAVDFVFKLSKDIGIRSVRELGMTEDDVQAFAESTIKNQTRLLSFNPKTLSVEECAGIYRDAMGD